MICGDDLWRIGTLARSGFVCRICGTCVREQGTDHVDGVCSSRSSSLARCYVVVTELPCARTSDVGRTKATGCVENGRDVGCSLLEEERLGDCSWTPRQAVSI